MKKQISRMFALLAAAALLWLGTLPAAAADAQVTYEGGAQNFIFAPGSSLSPTDLFVNYKNVQPGDTLSQTVHAKNTLSGSTTVRLYLRASIPGQSEQSTAFLKQMKLTVKQGSTTLSAGSADESAGLTGNRYLGSFASGASTDLTVELSVPLSMDNSCRDAIGKIDWIFTAEEIPAATAAPSTTTTSTTVIRTVNTVTHVPQTSDDTPVRLVTTLVMGSGAALIALCIALKKRSR
jgi:hypothetical protein